MRFRFAFSVFAAAGAVSLSLAGAPRALASAHHMFEDDLARSYESGAWDERWNESNQPGSWDSQYIYQFDQLPLEGKMAGHLPWSDTYWPTNRAGIAARWNWEGTNGFKYPLFTESQVRRMTERDLARLSPAEKYDIFMGRFDYPTVKMVRRATSPFAEYWAGICHGWAPAALNHAEPAPVTVTGPSEIKVPFGSADVKALIDNYYANNARASYFLGLKCQAGNGGNIFHRIASPFLNGPSCEDVNAGALHVILANELGLKHEGFVADVERWREVWNQPVFAYSSEVKGYRGPSHGSAPGTVKEALVHTKMLYADEVDPSWSTVVGTPNFKQGVEEYDYALELDNYGRIIGGSYLTDNRPDFLWRAPKLEFTGYYNGLNLIYRPAAP